MSPKLRVTNSKRKNFKACLTNGFPLIAMIFYAVILGGCTSNAIPGIYLFRFSKEISNSPEVRLEVRIGYLGVCAGTDVRRLDCAGRLRNNAIRNIPNEAKDFTKLGVTLAESFYLSVWFVILSMIFFFFGSCLALWHRYRINQKGVLPWIVLYLYAIALLFDSWACVSYLREWTVISAVTHNIDGGVVIDGSWIIFILQVLSVGWMIPVVYMGCKSLLPPWMMRRSNRGSMAPTNV